MKHDGVFGEKVALVWHSVWFGCSFLSLVLAAGGCVWHAWAVKQHRKELR